MTTAKPTPTPWTWSPNHAAAAELKGAFVTAAGMTVAMISAREPKSQAVCEANAAHIVRCVNSHAELVEALRETLARLEYFENLENVGRASLAAKVITQARAALARATGGGKT